MCSSSIKMKRGIGPPGDAPQACWLRASQDDAAADDRIKVHAPASMETRHRFLGSAHASRGSLDSSHDAGCRNIELATQSQEHVDGWRLEVALKLGDVGAIDVGAKGQLFLRQTGLEPGLP